jgi:hypothetical protein
MDEIKRYGLVVSGIGLAGIIFLIYRGTPLFSLQDLNSVGYYPAILGYVFFALIFGVGLILLALHREATQESV